MRRLSETARRIADGHWQERVGHLKGAEPEEVGQAFNSMLDELAAVQKRLVQSASLSAIGELSARVVHEMRNPLSSVKMNLKALREQVKDDPTYCELAEIASGQVGRLERMLNDLLQYGKPLKIRKERLRFKDLAGDVTAALTHQADARRVELKVRDNTNGRAFAADREQIVRAVTNLVDNAIRVAPEKSDVKLTAVVTGKMADAAIAISVLDAGSGIPRDVMAKLFKPFFTTRGDGTGLGLANVRKIAEMHGGEVDAENLPKGGAKFTLTLPLGEQA
jgi:signal transduction histidine kinase